MFIINILVGKRTVSFNKLRSIIGDCALLWVRMNTGNKAMEVRNRPKIITNRLLFGAEIEFGNNVRPIRKVETIAINTRVPLISIIPRILGTSSSESILTHLITTINSIIIRGTIERKVICQLKYSTIVAPNPRPTTAPAEKTEVKIP
jgi:hypothetical protein